jgi:hypothetical protein
MNRLPAEDLPVPSQKELYVVPYDKGVLLHYNTKTRWYQTDDGLIRDLTGERDWAVMGGYVGKTYQEVFLDAYLRSEPLRSKSLTI